MTLFAMADNGLNIGSQIDANALSALTSISDYIISDIGNNFTCSASGLNVTMQSGQGSIQGRFVTDPIGSSLAIPANSSGYIVIRLDLSAASGNEPSLKAVSSLVQDDLRNAGTKRDLLLYSYVANATTVTLTDRRAFNALSAALAGVKSNFTIGTQDATYSFDVNDSRIRSSSICLAVVQTTDRTRRFQCTSAVHANGDGTHHVTVTVSGAGYNSTSLSSAQFVDVAYIILL